MDLAVKAAHSAFHEGEWGKMNARDRGALLYKLADLMDQACTLQGTKEFQFMPELLEV